MRAASCGNSRAKRSPSTTSSPAPSTSERPAPLAERSRSMFDPTGAADRTSRSMADASAAPAARPRRRLGANWDLRIRQRLDLLAAVALFAALYLVYQLNHPKGFTSQVFIQNANEAFALALVAMAQTVQVLMEGIDLSVGAIMTLVGCIASHLVIGGPLQIAFGLVTCIAAGAACGFINGCVVVYGRIQPI